MSNEVVKGRGGLWRMVEVGGIAAAAGGFLLIGIHHPSPTFTNLHRPPAADIHTEYVKFPSGRDTITAYLAYPERKDPAPVVVVIHEIFGMSDFIRQTTKPSLASCSVVWRMKSDIPKISWITTTTGAGSLRSG